MVYFRNKFDEEFLFLCNEQTPKGGSVRLDSDHPSFFNIVKNKGNPNQPDNVRVIPLLLFNKIRTNNAEDKIVEDYIALCEDKNDTVVTCSYDKNYTRLDKSDYICNLGITTITGDLES